MLSATGLCLACADVRKTDNMNQMVSCEGPYFDHWARRCFMAYRKLVLDDLQQSA